jgi:tRNA(Ile)-lysidine synthase
VQLKQRFHKSLLKSGYFSPGCRILVAVSGGADSVALLALLSQLSQEMQLHLEVAHLDHALRQESSDDARFVSEMCAKLELNLTLERQDVAEIARRRKGNLEEVARDVRRDFLMATAKDRGCHLVALGHHADDQSETFLLRLLRGSRTTGLSGMRAVSALFVRPLLPFSREELLDYLQEEGYAWREDKSNLDQSFTRNRIRHHLMPILREFNPNVSRHLAGLCEQMQQDDDYWSDLVDRELPHYGQWRDEEFVLDRPRLLTSQPALASRLIRTALQRVRGDLRGISSTHIADIMALLHSATPQGELDLSGAWVARRYDLLVLRKEKPMKAESFSYELTAPGAHMLPDGRVLKISLVPESLGESSNVVEFAAASLSFPLQVRHFKPGDRFHPSGMTGTKKLQDLFVDIKLTKEERRKTLLLVKGDEVLWVAGLRRSEGRRPEPGEPVLQVILETQIDS